MAIQKLFGTSGIRGEAQKLFTNQFCFDIGRSFAKLLDLHKQFGPVAIGLDPRPSSLRIFKSVSQGLIFAGREVISQGYCPIPAVNYILKTTHYAGSIMVTGSHIDISLNGFKFFIFKEEILKDNEKELERIYAKTKEKIIFKKRETLIKKEKKAKKAYAEMLINLSEKPYPRWRVVVDPGNGAQSEFMSKILFRLGLEVIAINDSLKRGFISRDTEIEGAFLPLQERVLKEKADFGIGYDADGDRVIFVDQKGKFVPGDYTGALIAKYSDTPVVVTPINTSQVVEYLGKPVIRTMIGSLSVIEGMKLNKATFGFEANGGGISSEIMMSRDGGSTTIKILNLLKKSKKSFSQIIQTLPYFCLYRMKVNCPIKFYEIIYQTVKKKFKGIRIEELGCLKIWVDNSSWILFRGSGNAPEFRVFAEAKEERRAKKLAEEGMSLVKKVIKKGL